MSYTNPVNHYIIKFESIESINSLISNHEYIQLYYTKQKRYLHT